MRSNEKEVIRFLENLILADVAGFFPLLTQTVLDVDSTENEKILKELVLTGVIEQIYVQITDDHATVVEGNDIREEDKDTIYNKYIFTDAYMNMVKYKNR